MEKYKKIRLKNVTSWYKMDNQGVVFRFSEKCKGPFWNEVPYRTLHSRRLANES
jgi:hypothetical protein